MRGLGLVVYGGEGMGKTSFALQFAKEQPPKPKDDINLTCISIGETGYEDLEIIGKVPPKCENYYADKYNEIIRIVSRSNGHLVIDGCSGLQAKLFKHVCETDFNGVWSGPKGVHSFTGFFVGQRTNSPPVLQELMEMLDKIRAEGRHVIVIGHMVTADVPNTLGADFRSHVLDMDQGDKGGVRSVVTKWAQAILFMNIDVSITHRTEVKDGQVMTGKAKDVDTRLIYTTKSPGHSAKNRLELPDVINMGSSPEEAYENFVRALPKAYRENKFPQL